jgi:hypothetical protein
MRAAESLPKPLFLVVRDLKYALSRAFYDTSVGQWWDDLQLERGMKPLRARADAGTKTWKEDVTEVFLRTNKGKRKLAEAMLVPLQVDASQIPEGHVLISTSELARVAAENAHLLKQITELQQHGTLREEQLRAYRRMELSKEQLESVKRDLEETTARVLKGYGMEPMHEIPLPRVVNGAV